MKSQQGVSMLVLVALLAVADAAGSRQLLAPAPACSTSYVYRYQTFHKYDASINATDAAKAEMTALKACQSNFITGIMGPDMGAGPIFFPPTAAPNWQLAKVLDFKDQASVKGYKDCMKKQKVPEASQKAKVIYKVDTCPEHSITTLNTTHLYMFNITSKPNNATIIGLIDGYLSALVTEVDCLISLSSTGGDLGWGTALEEKAGVMQAYGGVTFYKAFNHLRGYWGFALGPPTTPNLAAALSYVDNALRIQIYAQKVK